MKRFILIDGNAIMHRAFHALPPLTNKDGELSNAVYGFFSMFLKILEDFSPTYLIVCFDRPKPTFRQTLYAGYQAARPKMSDDLPPQIVKVHEILESAKIPIFEIDGFEADDLIGTLSVKIVESSLDIEVIIVSGDRDLLQLVNDRVKMLAPVTGLSNTILYDEQAVEKKFGVKPSQIIDYKALTGDASDNYPGVAGIGPKTASGLLGKYHTFENIYKNIGDLPEKIGLRLATDAEQASLAKKLATIIVDVPIVLDIELCDSKLFDKEVLEQKFELNGFNSLVKRISLSLKNGYVRENDITEKSTSEVKKEEQLDLL
ncbi:MAG: hypothetical protein NTZ20_03455 [Candidatus Levybacteria bacterium]|nr:hypothetical protein [Candidatus Levybacteria bacterium]